MVAAVLLTIGATAAALQSARSHALRRYSEETLAASAHLRSVLAAIREEEPADLLDEDGDFAPGALAASDTVEFVLSEQRTTVEYPGYTTGDEAPTLLPVRVVTEWNAADGSVRSLEMCTVVKR